MSESIPMRRFMQALFDDVTVRFAVDFASQEVAGGLAPAFFRAHALSARISA